MWGTQRIEAYDTFGSEANCYVCDGGNRANSEYCVHCRAPLSLSAQTNDRKKKPPTLIAVLGAPAAGKTAYLGMLTDILSRQLGSTQMLARGAFSVSLQQASINALSQRHFPEPTPPDPEGWNWVHCEVSGPRRKKPIDLVLPDISGDAFLSELEHPSSVPVIQAFLQKCSAAMLLIDADRLEQGDQGPDFAAMKIVSYLSELPADKKNDWTKRPVAIVFTKADRSPSCFDDPHEYGQRSTPGFWRQCQERLGRQQVFATSVVAATLEARMYGETVRLPLRIEPRGTVEPFEWILNELAI